jgi:hypothetical protein
VDAYIFQSDIYCDNCATDIKADLIRSGAADGHEPDSNSFPQGPYSEGGGEADCPQHCGHCRTFLDNPLTGDGETYVRDAFREFVETGRGNPAVLGEWKQGYDWVWDDFADITFADMTDDGNVSDLMQRRFDDLASR